MQDHKYGTDPKTGRALNKDGTVRKARTKLTAAQKAAKAREAVVNASKSLGREAVRSVELLALFVASIGTFRKWSKDAVSFSTPEKRAAKRAWYEAQLAAIDAKGEAAEAWLPSAESAIRELEAFEANVGEDVMAFIEANGRAPDPAESEAMVRKHLSDDVRSLVEGAADPANDPFAAFRRSAVEPDEDADGDDEDTLSDED